MIFWRTGQGGEVAARAKVEAGLRHRKITGARAVHLLLKNWRRDISRLSFKKNIGSVWVLMEVFSFVK